MQRITLLSRSNCFRYCTVSISQDPPENAPKRFLYKISLAERTKQLSTEFYKQYNVAFESQPRYPISMIFNQQEEGLDTAKSKEVEGYIAMLGDLISKETTLEYLWHTLIFLTLEDLQGVRVTKDKTFFKSRRSADSLVNKLLIPETFVSIFRKQRNQTRLMFTALNQNLSDYGVLRNALILDKYAKQKKIQHELFGVCANKFSLIVIGRSIFVLLKRGAKGEIAISEDFDISDRQRLPQVLSLIRQIVL